MISLLECPLYVDHKNILLQTCQVKIEGFANMDFLDKFIEIMKNKNGKVVTALVKYVYNSMIKRCESTPYTPPNHKSKKKKNKNK